MRTPLHMANLGPVPICAIFVLIPNPNAGPNSTSNLQYMKPVTSENRTLTLEPPRIPEVPWEALGHSGFESTEGVLG